MSYEDIELALAPLIDRWWAPVARGIVAILFGILAFVAPVASVTGLVLVWGVFAFANGVLALGMAVRRAGTDSRWGWFLFEGIVGMGVGLLAFVAPGISAFALVGLIAAWAILIGIAEIITAIELRRLISGEWMLGGAGVLSTVCGVLLLSYPTAGTIAVVWIIGAYAIAFGALLVALGVQLKRLQPPGEQARPVPRRRPPRRDITHDRPSQHV